MFTLFGQVVQFTGPLSGQQRVENSSSKNDLSSLKLDDHC